MIDRRAYETIELASADLEVINPQARRLYEQLVLSERKYRDLFDSAPDMYHILDLEGNFLELNPKHMELLGYSEEELLGQNFCSIVPEDQLACFQRGCEKMMANGGHLQDHQIEINKKDGSRLTVDVHVMVVNGADGEPKEMRCIMRDITERKRLEEQLRQSQKMESIGQLAGGIAHDFNNLLTAIMGHTKLAVTEPQVDAGVKDHLEQISEAAERAAALTRQLLSFSRRQVVHPRLFELNRLVSDMERMLTRVISENISLHTSLDPDLPQVKMDPGQMEQVLMNLVVNARDAMPDGGEIHVETLLASVDEEAAASQPEGSPSEYVVLKVSDTGVGMSEDVMERIFEPFYTTKGEGKGTGLGLAMCYGIIKQNGGFITASSEVGRGTTFSVCIPPARAVENPAEAAEPAEREQVRA